ncbi:serine/threonine-protein kinase [Streptosporangium sandarakinum]|uniref:hypothetical protein n=1 Tax=Streptosporangium sandarakinum TaxID=1260955 RepID=UPI003710EA83
MVGTHTKTKATTKRPVDWSLTPRGPISATVQGSLALAAAATVGDAVALSPIWGGTATAAGALALVVAGAHRQLAPSALLYRLGCWIGAGAWWTYTLAATPWTQGAWAALGIGGVVAGLMAPLGRSSAKAQAAARAGGALVLRASTRIGTEWETRIRRVCRIAATVTAVQPWPTGAGYDVFVDLPGAGSTRAQLAGHADALATDARLPEGCGVEVRPGAHRGAVVLKVATVNRLMETIPYPAARPGSILTPRALGEYRDSETAAVLLRESSVLVTGQKGSGKTNTLHVLTAEVGLCTDALVWHIDLNGGGMSQAWLHPWLEAGTGRPAIDWAAATPEEGLAIAEAAVAIAKDRKKSTRALKIQANSSLMPVSAALPEIVVLIDEGAEALSPTNRDPVLRDLREAIEELQRIGRNEACNVVVSSLRATSDMIAPNIKKQSAVRVGMYVQDEEELGYLFGYNRGVSTADLPGPGCGFLADGQGAPRPFRAYGMQPGTIVEIAQVIARVRPELDEAARRAAGQEYEGRYGRMRRVFTDLDGQDDDHGQEPTEELPAAPRSPAVPPVGRRHLTAVPGGADASAWGDPLSLARRTRPVPVVTDASAWPDPPKRMRAEQMHPVDAPARPVPQIVVRALAAMADANDDRMHSATLAEALGVTPTELAALLRPLGVTTLPRAFLRGGREARGYAREDLQTAAERIGRGEVEVPADVAAWPAA